MTTNSPQAPSGVAGPASQPRGFLGRVFSKITGSLIDAILSHIWGGVIVALSPLLGYIALWQTDVVPGPAEIVTILTDGRSRSVTPPRAEGIVEVKPQGDGLAGDKARAIQIRITSYLRPMPATFGGVRVRYALGPLRSGTGATSATSVRWALAARGTEWLICPDVPLVFTSERALAEQVASRINNSLLASETAGELQCG
jgi:hypothetical protein